MSIICTCRLIMNFIFDTHYIGIYAGGFLGYPGVFAIKCQAGKHQAENRHGFGKSFGVGTQG